MNKATMVSKTQNLQQYKIKNLWQKQVYNRFIASFLLFFIMSCSALHPEPYYFGAKSDHFNGKVFVSDVEEKISDYVTILSTSKDFWGSQGEEFKPTKIDSSRPINRARITFIGHSTTLIQLAEMNILTDPIFSNRAGPIPLPLFSPKRHYQPGLEFEKLPHVDYVLLSSNSYYHMDIPSIKKLHKKFKPMFVTGLGNCYYLNMVRSLDLQCVELDWNRVIDLGYETKLYFLKAKNFSKRDGFDKNKVLWGSFAIMSQQIKIFFAGDTGFSKHLIKIGQNVGPFDVALLPIGSYEPREVLSKNHLTPEDAIRAHNALGAMKSIGIHFNTFQTTAEGYYDSLIELEELKKVYEIKLEEFIAPKFGEVFEL